MEILKYCAWPAAALLFAIFFVLLFRKPIETLIGRVKGISKHGILTTSSQFPQILEKKKPVDGVMESFNSVVVRETEDSIRKDLHEKKVHDSEEMIKVLVKHLAINQLAYKFELIDRIIFGSQIRLLQHLNSMQGEPVDTLKVFYDYAAKDYPMVYENYSFESYLNFLFVHTLITKIETLYFITNFGREYLTYITQTGKSLSRFA